MKHAVEPLAQAFAAVQATSPLAFLTRCGDVKCQQHRVSPENSMECNEQKCGFNQTNLVDL